MSHPPLRVLLWAYLTLILLLAVTVGSYFLPLGRWNMVVGMMVAVSKAMVVVMVFMHVAYRTSLTRLVASVGFIWLSILITLTLVDYLTRVTSPFNF